MDGITGFSQQVSGNNPQRKTYKAQATIVVSWVNLLVCKRGVGEWGLWVRRGVVKGHVRGHRSIGGPRPDGVR